MFGQAADLKAAILEIEPDLFVSRFIFEPIPFAFADDLDLWISWKNELAAALQVDPYEMVLTGSAAIGFSLNPKKSLAPFSIRSDVDVGVVSLHHFEVAWRHLRQSRPSWLTLPASTHRVLQWHRKNYVFAGAIATDLILPLLPFGQQWQLGLEAMGNRNPTLGREVRLRIYRDFEALRSYQAHNIRNLRDDLLEVENADTVIDLEED
jgi:hypothetical protein